MPRVRGVLSRPRAKPGTKNSKQAAAREERREAEAAATRIAAAEVLADLASPLGAEHPLQEAETPATETVNENKAVKQERQRQAIIVKYELLQSPTEDKWDGRGGTVALIAQWLDKSAGTDVRFIRRTLERHVAGEALAQWKGALQKLSHGEALIAADCLARGLGRE